LSPAAIVADRWRRLHTSVIARNTALQVANQSFSVVAGLFIFGMSARALGADGYGEFVVAVTYAAFVGIVLDAGLDTYLVKELAASGAASTRSFVAQRLVSDALLLRVTLAAVATSAAVGAGMVVGYDRAVVVGIAVLSLNALLGAVGMLVANIYQAAVDVRVTVLLWFVTRAVSTGLVAWLFITEALDLESLILGTLFGGVAGAVTVLLLGYRRGLRLQRLSGSRSRRLYRTVAPLAAWVVLGQVIHRADAIILSVVPLDPGLGVSNAEAVGTYAAAYKLYELAVILASFVVVSLMPRLAVLARTEPAAFAAFKNAWLIRMSALGLGVAALFLLFGEPALVLVAGDDLGAAAQLVPVLAVAIPFVFANALLFSALVALERQAGMAVLYAAVAAVNVVANLLLAPRFGYWATASVTVMSQVLLTAGMMALLHWRTR
jgi:O-antigen/teichoic acid export membrane protein